MNTRRCGDCGACCDVLGVPGFKEQRARCPHMRPCGTNRCTIHADPEKPDACAGYVCMWLQGNFQPGDRPDQLGVIFDGHEQDGYYVVMAREVRPGAASAGRAARLIDQMSVGMVVIVVPHDDGNRRLVCRNRAIVAKLRPKLAALGVRV